jgi:hypothetical protein
VRGDEVKVVGDKIIRKNKHKQNKDDVTSLKWLVARVWQQ